MTDDRPPVVARPSGFWRMLFRAYDRASLETKLVVGAILVALIGLALMLAALAAVIVPIFDVLEQQSSQRNIDRTVTALDSLARNVETSARDYGAWDESYSYITNPTRAFEDNTLSDMTITNLGVNGVAYARLEGSVVFSKWIDLANGVEINTQSRLMERSVLNARILAEASRQDSKGFFARIGDKIAAVGVAKIYRTDGSGTPSGLVFMVKELSSDQLRELLKLDATVVLPSETSIRPDFDASRFREHKVAIRGVDGKGVAYVHFITPRELSAMGFRTLAAAMAASIVVMIIAMGFLMHLMRRLAIQPLRRLEGHMQAISHAGDLRPFDEQLRGDEIGSLVRNFNQMLGQLKDLRERVEIQSFKLGKTESAIGLMHNVRNGLNPLNIILSQATSRELPVDPLLIRRALSELSDEATDIERRRKLADFIDASLAAQSAGSEEMRKELSAARTHLARVVDLIGDQQAAAHERVEKERCTVRSVIEQNAALARYSTIGNVRFEVIGGDPEVLANRLLLSQVFGNLFGNAMDSIQAAGRKKGVVEVSFSAISFRGSAGWEVRVRDNGEGFDPAKRKQLFEQGFSTRKNKSGGLGLHWCANAIGMMDGELSLESEGLGLGATAVIRLQAAPDQPSAGNAFEDMVEPLPASDSAAESPDRAVQSLR